MTDEWTRVTLGSCYEHIVQRCEAPQLPAETRYFGMEHLQSDSPTTGIGANAASVSGQVTHFRSGDTLFGRLRPYLRKVSFATTDGVCSPEVLVLRPQADRVLPRFLHLLASSEQVIGAAVAASAGSRMPRTSARDLGAIEIPLPPLVVQRRIVDLMEHLDTHLANLEAEHKCWTSFARALRHSVFSGLDVPEVPAGEKFDMLLGRQKSERQSTGDHVIPYLRAANIGEAGFRLSDVGTMNFDLREQAKYGLRTGDVLLVEGGSIGLSALWTSQIPGPVGFDKHLIRLRPVEGSSTSPFALQWTRWCHETGAFDDQATGITIRALGFGRASKMPVPDLSVEQQDRLMAPLVQAEACTEALGEEIGRLQKFRSAALASILSQAHDIPDSYDSLLAVS